MAERYKFSVAYEPAILRSAVRAHIVRAMWAQQKLSLGIAGLAVAVAVVAPPVLNGFDRDSLVTALGVVIVLAAAVAGWLYWMGSRAKLARVSDPQAVFVFSDDAVEMTTDQGSGRFAWASVRQVWKFKRYWLLMIDLNRFVTLPLAEAPPEALQFLDQKIEPRPFKAA